MAQNRRKKTTDSLIEVANVGDTRGKKKLRAWLRTIARRKNREIPRKILDELEKVNKKVHFHWTRLKETDRPGMYASGVEEIPSETLYEIHRQFEREIENEPEFRPLLGAPHLGSYEALPEFSHYLWQLIPKLRDPDWVAALSQCPACGKLLLNFTKRRTKYCDDNPECREKGRKRIWARKNKRRFKCPGLEGIPDEMTKQDCTEIQGSDDPFPECQSCPKARKKD
ncbi:MAG: hypothetical protein GTO24_15800 [candidate division Zixibacteria bacterium]|nr:hypothetical protein [candidate division Zixibacteria bacterium]